MKTQISRSSFRAERRYSGVYQQQGRMIVDADLNEQTDISRTRLESALLDVIGGGIPAAGGLDVTSDGNGGIDIVPGRVYVDGIPAEVTAPQGASTVPYGRQEDFPDPPELPVDLLSPPASPPEGAAYTVYVDVWERTVLALEDPELVDPGLHGADTCTRTRTMAQIKWCPAGQNPEEPTFNPRIGNAALSLALRDATTAADPCDPCAEVVDLDTVAGNYLFRVEVHDLGRDAGGNRTLTLKWSSENGAEQYHVANLPTDFTAGQWVYEFYNAGAEKHLGWHLATAPGFPERGVLRTDFAAGPDAATHPYVRRWDGFCTLVRTGGVWRLATDAAGAGIGVDRGVPLGQTNDPVSRLGDVNVDDELTINLDRMRLTLTLREGGFDRTFVPGDFWIAPVREQDAGGSPLLDRAEPHGIEHHYLLLADVDGNVVTKPEGAVCNRYAFPPLTNIAASGICFENTCPDLFGAEADNLQDALTNLCNQLDAADVVYGDRQCPPGSPSPSLRALLQAHPGLDWPDVDADGAATVRDVLDALLCYLDAARLPFDASAQQARWQAITEGAAAPVTAQQAIDALARDLDADDIALDKADTELCDRLRPAEVVSVQDALNVLCRTSGGGCAHTVGEGGTFATLDDAFEALVDADVVALCLLPGEHDLRARPQNRSLRTVRISGAGTNAALVRLRSDYLLSADEVILEGVSFSAPANRGLVLEAQRVSVRGCRFERIGSTKVGAPLVMVRGEAGVRLDWHDNALLAIARPEGAGDAARLIVPGNRVLGSRNRTRTALNALVARDPGLEPAAYAEALDTAAAGIAALDVSRRRDWAEQRPTERIAALPDEPSTYLAARPAGADGTAVTTLRRERSSRSPRDATDAFYRAVAAPRISTDTVRSALDEVMRASAASDFDRGLGLADPGVGGAIEHSSFDADVVLNAGLDQGLVLEAGHLPRDESLVPVAPGANLHLSGNRLQRVLSLIPPDVLDANGRVARPAPGHRSAFVSENAFSGEENGFVASAMNMQGNHYDVTATDAVLASVLGEFAAFTGNWSAQPLPIRTSIVIGSRRSSSGNLQIAVS